MTRFAALFAVAALAAAPATAQDPFSQGLVWAHAADPAAPWIPRGVAFAGAENFVWAAGRGTGGRLLCLDEPGAGAVAPRALDTVVPAGATTLGCAAGRRGDALFTVAQHPDPTDYERRTRVHRHDPLAGGAFAPVWTHDAGFTTNGPARIAADESGARVVLAVWNDAQQTVQVDWLDGTTGALIARRYVGGWSLQSLAISDDGERVAFTSGLELRVLGPSGPALLHVTLDAATPALGFAGDGRSLAAGGVGAARVWREDAAGAWSELASFAAPATEVATRLDFSRDGAELAIGWWNHVAGNALRLEVRDVDTRALLNDHAVSGGALQNLPEVVRLTPDGRRVALGTWGDGGEAPEVLVFAVGSPRPLLELDAPGSVVDLGLTDDGTRVAVAHKNGHHNLPGATGGVLLAQTGDRTIDQLDPAVLGRELRVHTRLAGASGAFLLIGDRVDPVPVTGVQGWLELDRATLRVRVGALHGGTAKFSLGLPDDPVWAGVHVGLQPAFRVRGGTLLAPHVLEPLLLQD